MTLRDPSSQSPFQLWLHIKTSNLYAVLYHGVEEATLTPIVIYRREDGTGPVWTRPCDEFYDGRFVPYEKIGKPPSWGAKFGLNEEETIKLETIFSESEATNIAQNVLDPDLQQPPGGD